MKYFFKIFLGIAFTAIFYFVVFESSYVKYFDNKIYDTISSAISSNTKNVNSSVVIVDIDEKSLKYLGQWPWSRLILAKLIKNIKEAKPANIGLDIIFPEKDKTSLRQIKEFFKNYFAKNLKISGVDKYLFDNDKIFANELSNAKVTLSVYLTNNKNKKCFLPKKNMSYFGTNSSTYQSSYMLCNYKILQKSASNIGFINIEKDKDGILRRSPVFIKYGKYLIPSFALANLMNIDKINIKNNKISILNHTFKTGQNSDILLNFQNKNMYNTISAVNVLSGKFNKNLFLGKFVLIGTTAIGLHDHYTISNGENIPGVLIQASIINNILNNSVRYQPKIIKLINIFMSFIFSWILLFLIYKKEYMKVFLSFFFVSSFYIILGIYFLKHNIYISVGYFLVPYSIFYILFSTVFLIFYYMERKSFLENLTNAHSETIDSMSLVAETRDAETGAHIIRTKEYMKCLADYLYKKGFCKKDIDKNYIELIYRATPLHDIGKVGIPDYILKKSTKLTNEEYEIMKQHSEIGKKIIENAMKNNNKNLFLQIAYNIAYYHHEKWDGSGYPCGLKKEEIPLEARMMALVDVYDALISKRCYKPSFTYKDSEDIIIQGSGAHFDPMLVEAFLNIKDNFRQIAKNIK